MPAPPPIRWPRNTYGSSSFYFFYRFFSQYNGEEDPFWLDGTQGLDQIDPFSSLGLRYPSLMREIHLTVYVASQVLTTTSYVTLLPRSLSLLPLFLRDVFLSRVPSSIVLSTAERLRDRTYAPSDFLAFFVLIDS